MTKYETLKFIGADDKKLYCRIGTWDRVVKIYIFRNLFTAPPLFLPQGVWTKLYNNKFYKMANIPGMR